MKRILQLEEVVKLSVGGGLVTGKLSIPFDPRGVIIFSHPSDPPETPFRNQMVAQVFNKEGFATLLIDLGIAEEQCSAGCDAGSKLADQLISATRWISAYPDTHHLPIGYFGTCAGAGAVLKASLEIENAVLVCRGGNPEAVLSVIEKIKSPVLLIVGEKDVKGVEANRLAFNHLAEAKEKELKVISGASHYFSELGKLGEVAVLAASWYKKHLSKVKTV